MKKRFIRQQSFLKRLEKKWRRPKGRHSKLRLKRKSRPKMPNIGYKKSDKEKIRIIRIENEKQLDKIKEIKSKEKIMVYVGKKVGKKKKEKIKEKAKQMGIKIEN